MLLEEIEQIHAAGQGIEFEAITGDDAREIEPSLSDEIGAAIRLHGQRFINPGEYVQLLADSVIARGGQIISGVDVKDIVDEIRGVRLVTGDGETDPFDAVVMATGAWLNDLARDFGVRRSSRPVVVTASACRSRTCRPDRCTSRRSGSPARRWATGSGSPG